MTEFLGLPLYDAVTEVEKDEHGVKKLSFVTSPANKQPLLKFNNNVAEVRLAFNEERRLVTVVIMQPEFPMYRDMLGHQFYVQYTSEQIEVMRDKFMEESLLTEVNVEHKEDVEGMQMVETWIVDSTRGISAPDGLGKLEDGAWIATFRVHNDEVWGSILDGTYSGISLEGVHALVPSKEVAEEEKAVINAELFTTPPQVSAVSTIFREEKGTIGRYYSLRKLFDK